MPSPPDRDREFRLERLGNRDDLRRAHLSEAAQVASPVAGIDSVWEYQGSYAALIDAVFTAPGVAEWLLELQRAMAARFAGEDAAPRTPAARDAIRKAGPGPWRA
jgi:hypothetical protein